MTIPITVTQSDIFRGAKSECETCPIALAVRRVMPKANVQVTPHSIVFGYKLHSQIHLPEKARNFIRKFDAGDKMEEPFTFDIEMAQGIAAEYGCIAAQTLIG